jgi:hypothetical protein
VAGIKAKKGKKNRKLGRNQKACTSYSLAGMAERNRLKRMRRHLRERRHQNDAQGMKEYLAFGGSEDSIYT